MNSRDIPMTFMAIPWLPMAGGEPWPSLGAAQPRISLLPETWFVQQLFNSDTLVAGRSTRLMKVRTTGMGMGWGW